MTLITKCSPVVDNSVEKRERECWKLKIFMMPTLSTLVAPEFVTTTTCGTAGGGKVSIMKINYNEVCEIYIPRAIFFSWTKGHYNTQYDITTITSHKMYQQSDDTIAEIILKKYHSVYHHMITHYPQMAHCLWYKLKTRPCRFVSIFSNFRSV